MHTTIGKRELSQLTLLLLLLLLLYFIISTVDATIPKLRPKFWNFDMFVTFGRLFWFLVPAPPCVHPPHSSKLTNQINNYTSNICSLEFWTLPFYKLRQRQSRIIFDINYQEMMRINICNITKQGIWRQKTSSSSLKSLTLIYFQVKSKYKI